MFVCLLACLLVGCLFVCCSFDCLFLSFFPLFRSLLCLFFSLVFVSLLVCLDRNAAMQHSWSSRVWIACVTTSRNSGSTYVEVSAGIHEGIRGAFVEL